MNPISATTWFWRGWRGRSVTFAALFATSVLGILVLGGFRHLLSRMGAPWYVWLIVPFVAVGFLARKETEWLPDPERRRRWAWGLVFGSIIIALLVARLTPKPPEEPAQKPVPGRSGQPVPHGR